MISVSLPMLTPCRCFRRLKMRFFAIASNPMLGTATPSDYAMEKAIMYRCMSEVSPSLAQRQEGSDQEEEEKSTGPG